MRIKTLFLLAVFVLSQITLAPFAYAITCGAGTDIGGGQCRAFLTSGTSWSVPSDWNSSSNSIEVIGGGGGGAGPYVNDPTYSAGSGGGGGGYSKTTNVSLTPSGSVTYAVGSAGSAGAINSNGGTGGDTYFCNSTSNCTSISGSAVVAGAKGGSPGAVSNSYVDAAGGAGGSSSSGIGSTKYSGGSGGAGRITGHDTFSVRGAGGGGGSGGNTANGSAGTAGYLTGGSTVSGPGGAGGATNGGSGGTGGGYGSLSSVGGNGTTWDATHGAGGGGGGAGYNGDIQGTAGSAGGNYGGGGGGGSYASGLGAGGGAGAQGIIVITYAPSTASSRNLNVTKKIAVNGNVSVSGAISKGSGTFVIDHPLDPENKLLYHSFVESPDVLNIYDGIATLDERGEARVRLPAYYEALNTNAQYFLSSLDAPSSGLYVKERVRDNVFVIAGGNAGQEVSWMVTGVRHDPYILANPIIPEVEKGPDRIVDKGEYLFPDFYAPQSGLFSRLISWLRNLF